MELGQLRAILALAELTSFSRAAERLHLSTPAVFNQIRQLGDHLGDRLYERVGRRLELTAKGKLLAEHAVQILAAYDRAMADMMSDPSRTRIVLRIGSGPYSSTRILPYLLRAFLGCNPDVEVRFIGGDDQSLLDHLRTGALDALLLSLPVGDPALVEEPLWVYDLAFAVPPARCENWAMVNSPAGLADKPFILFRRPVVVDHAVQKLCASTGATPHVIMESDDPASIIELVKLGIGFSILPSLMLGEEAARGELTMLRAPESPFHEYGILVRASNCEPRILTELRRVAREWREWWPLARYVSPAVGGVTTPRSYSSR
jgi:DNA-binding transcriptional LysR family regulator